MKLLESIIQDLFDYRESFKRKKITSHYKNDLVMLACMRIYKHYMILPPTPRNVQIMENLLTLYPDLTIDTNYDPENRVTLDLFIVLNRSLVNNKISIHDVMNKLRNNCIIIKKNEDLNDFLDAAKVGNTLLSGKRYVIKQIGFFNSNGPQFNSFNACLLDKLNSKFKSQDIDTEIGYINVNPDHSLTFEVKTFCNIKEEFELNNLKKVSFANELKKSIRKQIEHNLSFHSSLCYKKIDFGKSMQIHVNKSDYDIYHGFLSRGGIIRHKTGVAILLDGRIRKNRKVETWFNVKNITLEDFYSYIREMFKEELNLEKSY